MCLFFAVTSRPRRQAPFSTYILYEVVLSTQSCVGMMYDVTFQALEPERIVFLGSVRIALASLKLTTLAAVYMCRCLTAVKMHRSIKTFTHELGS